MIFVNDQDKLKEAIGYLNKLLGKMSPTRVLVIEDDPMDIVLIRRELEKFLCDVTYCEDGEKAIAAIKGNQWDIILIDQHVPKLTGNEILQETAGFRPGARVVVVTGNVQSPNTSAMLRNGAVIAFAKPITAETLQALGLVRI